MKALSIVVVSLFLAMSWGVQAMAAVSAPMKTCSTVMKSLDGLRTIAMTMEVFSQEGTLHAKVSQTFNGEMSSYEDVASFSEHSIRAGLASVVANEDFDTDELNLGERLIAHAILLSSDPNVGEFFSAGLDLNAVRSAKVYVIGEPASMGMAAIVEAHDESGKTLGTFLGGFVVRPCK